MDWHEIFLIAAAAVILLILLLKNIRVVPQAKAFVIERLVRITRHGE